jgi:hypothetical protein
MGTTDFFTETELHTLHLNVAYLRSKKGISREEQVNRG